MHPLTVATFTVLNKPSVPIPPLPLCVLVPLTCPGHGWMEQGVQEEGGECSPHPGPGPAPEEPGSASRCCHPRSIPSCLPAGVWLPIPSHPVSSHPASSCSIPSHTAPSPPRDVTPQRGEPQTPPGGRRAPSCAGGAHRDPVGSLTRLPRAQTGSWVPAVAGRRVPSCCWVSAETRVALPGVSGDRSRHSLLLDVCFICKLLARRGCCRALRGVRRCKPQASVALGTSSRGQTPARLPASKEVPNPSGVLAVTAWGRDPLECRDRTASPRASALAESLESRRLSRLVPDHPKTGGKAAPDSQPCFGSRDLPLITGAAVAAAARARGLGTEPPASRSGGQTLRRGGQDRELPWAGSAAGGRGGTQATHHRVWWHLERHGQCFEDSSTPKSRGTLLSWASREGL